MESQDENPYAPPEETELSATETAAFSGTVQASDVRRGLQNGAVTVLLVVLCAGSLIWFVVAIAHAGSAPLFAALIFALLLGGISYALGNTGTRFAAKFPNSMGEVKGVLSNKRFEFEWPQGKTWASSEALQFPAINRRGLLISTGVQFYLPASIFEDFETARQIATKLHSSGSTLTLGSTRLRSPVDPARLPERPDDALPLEGPLYAGDFDGTPIGRAIKKAGRGWVWLVITSLIVGGFCWAISESLELGLCVTVGFFLFFWFALYQRIHKQLRELNVGSDGEPTAAYYIAGWVNDEWLVSETNVGGGQYRWNAFAHHRVLDSERIALRVLGKVPHVILLTRRLHRSDEDWLRTLDLVNKHVETE